MGPFFKKRLFFVKSKEKFLNQYHCSVPKLLPFCIIKRKLIQIELLVSTVGLMWSGGYKNKGKKLRYCAQLRIEPTAEGLRAHTDPLDYDGGRAIVSNITSTRWDSIKSGNRKLFSPKIIRTEKIPSRMKPICCVLWIEVVKLSSNGFVCDYHSAVPASNPKHTIYTFIWSNFVLYLSLYWEKDEKNKKKAGFGPYFFKNLQMFFFVSLFSLNCHSAHQ